MAAEALPYYTVTVTYRASDEREANQTAHLIRRYIERRGAMRELKAALAAEQKRAAWLEAKLLELTGTEGDEKIKRN